MQKAERLATVAKADPPNTGEEGPTETSPTGVGGKWVQPLSKTSKCPLNPNAYLP